MNEKIFKGYNGDLKINNDGVTITRGAKGFLLQGLTLRGEKLIPWDSIVAVQYKTAGVVSGVGYLQLSLRGGSESKGGLLQSTVDENTVTWSNMRASMKNAEFAEARDIIQSRITKSHDVKICPACAEEIKAAATLCRFCGTKL